MEEQSSRFAKRRAAVAASVFGIAVFGVGAGVAVSGCGSDRCPATSATPDQSQAGSGCPSIRRPSRRAEHQTQIQSVRSRFPAWSGGGGY
jgi:hypothetical protein